MLDHFAELLSLHGYIAKAAQQLGRSTAWGHTQFRVLCKSLGAQAA